MKPIQIGRMRLSDVIWSIIDEGTEVPYEKIEKICKDQQALRTNAAYNTGSVGIQDACELYRVVEYFQPSTIAEVGTFVGVSTSVMRLATSFKSKIYTCDYSNDIDLGMLGVNQYKMTASCDMFLDMAKKGIKVDLMYLDGRLSDKDFENLNAIIHDKTVFVFDDFEGTEKGVANAMHIETVKNLLVYPRHSSRTAISIPLTLIHFVRQEPT